MGRPGSALDNAVIESWHSTLEFELQSLRSFATGAAARTAVAAWIEDYNHVRRHSALGMVSPVDYERSLAGKDAARPRQARDAGRAKEAAAPPLALLRPLRVRGQQKRAGHRPAPPERGRNKASPCCP
jgi:hypothetical protein